MTDRIILLGVAQYEYRCRECDAVFEALRPMAESDRPAVCPAGHDNAVRLLSTFATTGRMASGAPCGPACACHPG